MRNFNHLLCESKSGKSAVLKIEIDDRFGKKAFNLSFVRGWRKDFALKYLSFESKEWNENVARMFVGLQVLKSARNMHEAMQFINTVETLSGMEVHFWASKFMTNGRAAKAWRSLYE